MDLKPLIYILAPKREIPALAASRLKWRFIQLVAYTYDIEYPSITSKYHGNAHAFSWLPRKTTEEADDWSMEGDQVNRVQIERTPITASRTREATRGDPVLSRVLHFVLHGWPVEKNCVLHFVLHGWPVEKNSLEKHLYYCTKLEDFLASYQKSNTFKVSTGSVVATTPKPSRNGSNVLGKSLARLRIWCPNLDSNIKQTEIVQIVRLTAVRHRRWFENSRFRA